MPEPSAPAQSVSTAKPAPSAAPAANTAPTCATAGRLPPVPNARKGYKLTLWISATSDIGAADVHGLLQLDGADPIPFCRMKAVSNPLARALQEAYIAVERARAKPPKMAVPSPSPPSAPASPPQAGAPRAVGATPSPPRVSAPILPVAPARTPAAPTAGPKTTEPVAQPSLF